MDEAVDGMNEERELIFRAFDLGLAGNLFTVLCAACILMDPLTAVIGCCVIGYALYFIFTNVRRIRRKFFLEECVQLKDLTVAGYRYSHLSSNSV
jgi:hypothetical protein